MTTPLIPFYTCSVCYNKDACSSIGRCTRDFLTPSSLKEGVKFDSDKFYRPELITPEFIFELSGVLAYGAKKYEDRNWEKGMKWSRPFGALMRHLWAWWRGEDKDPETGFSHLAHAACNVMFLLTFQLRGSGTDDRFFILTSLQEKKKDE
ncbi:MAG: DUF5664 domain-containing protein [Sediminibacterium sp.]|jgi:hypothetical protein|nr:DUF5664 domain-containing protein [Sediminibacterium sp.]